MTATDDLLARLVQQVESRHFGKFRGRVSDNDDPDGLGRIKASVPSLLGDQETGWALPAFPYGGASEQGFFALPDVGAGVWIEFERGDLSYPIWTGTWYTSDAIPESAGPGKKVLKTTSGHKIVLDDDGGTLQITGSNGDTITMDGSTIKVVAGGSTKVLIDAPQIELVENASHPLVFGDQLLQYLGQLVQLYQTHTHPNQGAPLPPLKPPTPSIVSKQVKTG